MQYGTANEHSPLDVKPLKGNASVLDNRQSNGLRDQSIGMSSRRQGKFISLCKYSLILLLENDRLIEKMDDTEDRGDSGSELGI